MTPPADAVTSLMWRAISLRHSFLPAICLLSPQDKLMFSTLITAIYGNELQFCVYLQSRANSYNGPKPAGAFRASGALMVTTVCT